MNSLNLYEAKVIRGGNGYHFKEVYYFLIIAHSFSEACSFSIGIEDVTEFNVYLVAKNVAVGTHSRIIAKYDASVYYHAKRIDQPE